jgi:cation diffusion facilitator CzcD-associated flavoprotein CzcO
MSSAPSAPKNEVDVVVVGAGFAGLYMLLKLRGVGFSVRVIEEAGSVGGTWFWNRYPGARCDVESMEYSYQFDDALQQEWEWTERYATQPEILRYLNHVADRFDLRRDIWFDARVEAAIYDDAAGRWSVTTDDGAVINAAFCIMATGCLSCRNTPDFEGIDSFTGATYHTGDWPEAGVDFTGRRVGVIGTGSSAIQAIPMIAEQAEQLTVFQRTATYSVPAHNAPLDPEARKEFKAHYAELRAKAKQNRSGILFTIGEKGAFEVTPEEREREYEERWKKGGVAFMGAFVDLFDTLEANDTAAEYVRSRIRNTVRDAEVAELLSPRFLIGCKRLCVDTDYYATYNRDNVNLVDVSKTPIERITPDGLKVGGEAFELDAIVFATGFDAVTGALTRVDIRGRNGRSFAANWEDGPRTFLGLAVAGFPNLFTITGPGSPSVLSNMVGSIEQHVEFITDCLGYMRAHGHSRIEASAAAEAAWVAHVAEVASRSVYPKQDSWYIGSNIPGKARVFLSYIGVPQYAARCNEIAEKGYEGFALG